jgi:chemotaxis protein MotB
MGDPRQDQGRKPPPLPGAAPPKRRFPVKLLLFMLLFLSTTVLAGKYAWDLRGQLAAQKTAQKHDVDALATCKRELADAAKAGAGSAACEQERTALAAKQKEIDAHLAQMEANLSASRVELEQLRKERAEADRMLAAFKDATEKLKAMIDAGTLEVTMRNGAMVVRLPAEVLFPSGSAELSEKGQIAVIEVGVILKQFPDRRFLVVGHTDDVPLKSAQYRNNYELSTARAVTVTEFLVKAGMQPKRLIAAGHGEHDPVADNKSPAGRQKNRRIEIVLLPTIDELPELPAGGAAGAAAPDAGPR